MITNELLFCSTGSKENFSFSTWWNQDFNFAKKKCLSTSVTKSHLSQQCLSLYQSNKEHTEMSGNEMAT